jgi:hypothetical protein
MHVNYTQLQLYTCTVERMLENAEDEDGEKQPVHTLF